MNSSFSRSCLALMVAGGATACSDADVELISAPTPASCPVLVAGENILLSSGVERRVVLVLPDEPQGQPVVFGWHGLGGDPFEFLLFTGLGNRSDLIAVVPSPSGEEKFLWHLDATPIDNPDLILFDELLACLEEQFAVDPERVASMGVSAGALWTAYLVQHRADRLASVALLSGGLPDPSLSPPYVRPARPLPVLLEWGGDTDVLTIDGEDFVFNNGDPETFSFAEASRAFSEQLRADGHFVVECVGTQGHALPPDPESVWFPFLRDHPRDIAAEPYLNTFAPDLSALCVPP